MTDRELMQRALEALEHMKKYGNVFLYKKHEENPYDQMCDAVDALRERLAQPDPAPCNHEWFRTGAMEPNEARCLHCGEWRIKGKPQPDPEPVAFGYLWPTGMHPEFRYTQQKRGGINGTPVYTAPPRRKWQGLTDDEISRLRHLIDPSAGWSYMEFARAVEAKLKEKNT